MAAASTLPAVKTQVVALLTTALATSGTGGTPVPVFYSWQPDATEECVFLGRAVFDSTDRDEIDVTFEYPTAETNRPVFERYTVPISLWSFRPDLTPDDANDAETRLGVLLDVVLGVLNDVDLGLARLNSRPDRITWRRVAFQRGWACFAVIEPSVIATLT